MTLTVLNVLSGVGGCRQLQPSLPRAPMLYLVSYVKVIQWNRQTESCYCLLNFVTRPPLCSQFEAGTCNSLSVTLFPAFRNSAPFLRGFPDLKPLVNPMKAILSWMNGYGPPSPPVSSSTANLTRPDLTSNPCLVRLLPAWHGILEAPNYTWIV